jgi:hypothetical protein
MDHFPCPVGFRAVLWATAAEHDQVNLKPDISVNRDTQLRYVLERIRTALSGS